MSYENDTIWVVEHKDSAGAWYVDDDLNIGALPCKRDVSMRFASTKEKRDELKKLLGIKAYRISKFERVAD